MSGAPDAGDAALMWRWLGRLSHARAVSEMESARERVLAGGDEALLLCEHPPVITIGRSGRDDNVLGSEDVPVVRASRGGDVTYHGPGQLMVYPVVRLRGPLVPFLSGLAAALADTAAELGVPGAAWRRDPAGLWVGDAKLAACGIHLHRGVVVHGFALDVATPESAWRRIVPCGLSAARTTSIARERARRGLSAAPPIEEVAELAAPRLCAALGRTPRRVVPTG